MKILRLCPKTAFLPSVLNLARSSMDSPARATMSTTISSGLENRHFTRSQSKSLGGWASGTSAKALI